MTMFTPSQHRALLTLARTAIDEAVTHRRIVTPPATDVAFAQPLGAFVTLTQGGQLRGCIGFPEATFPLREAIVQGAVSAALCDPRFPPVEPHELDTLRIEISVLSPLITALPEEVVVGIHGMVVEQGRARGLLLPQVPVEWGWDRETFLRHTCRKAGLPLDAWQQDARLFTFTAEVFNEDELREPAAE